ncbi:LysR family transcriptional regulator [Mitsuokella sp. oral taxon 131]|uniref:LysR family transcriptional regulator n=1 Tax=Mitsuokella sp. oral taxon 131 TaxID=1321780 RepID=UPI0003AE1353|nr:LysR family transcriptional regulator [Mitsuokella sp. oral taxon 131]ERL25195.1 LysR substrate binding domain protein [Mitsuokella sp. oral taxon 131 str. W9106]
MNTQDIQLLKTLHRTSNITRTAEELYTTQSSVSKRIRQLEKELGIILVLRSRRGIQFTPAGEIVLRHVNAITRELTSMNQELNDTQGIISGTLRVGVSINYALYRLPPLLRRYQKRYSLVRTQTIIEASQKIYSMFIAGQIELAIVRGEYSDWTGSRILLGREPICAITCPEHCDLPLRELPQVIRKADLEMERDTALWCRENKIPTAKNQVFANSTATCIEMVRQGLGWGIVPKICLAHFDGCIRPMRFADGRPLVRSTYLLYTEQTAALPQIQAFIDLLAETKENL